MFDGRQRSLGQIRLRGVQSDVAYLFNGLVVRWFPRRIVRVLRDPSAPEQIGLEKRRRAGRRILNSSIRTT